MALGERSEEGSLERGRPRVVVIDQEDEVRKLLERNLAQAGYDVTGTTSGLEGLRLVREQRPDVVLLELLLPDLPGTDVCRALARDPATRGVPVIIVTARGDELDRVVGFELGAADYVVKPFSVRELVLRVRAVLERSRPPWRAAGVAHFGRLRIDRDAHRVWVDETEVHLTSIEYRLLASLHDRRNRVLPRATLQRDIWGSGPDRRTRTIDTHIKRLRAKLGPAAVYLRTIRGVGYRLGDAAEEP